MSYESTIKEARALAKYTEELAAGPDWGVSDQDTLEWLIDMAEQRDKLVKQIKSCQALYLKAAENCEKMNISSRDYTTFALNLQQILDEIDC